MAGFCDKRHVKFGKIRYNTCMNIAIVDDDRTETDAITGIIKEYAQRCGEKITIRTYPCGEEFVDDYRPYYYTAVFMDIYMEKMDGIETAARIRSADSNVAIIFLTSSNTHMPDAFMVHAFDYIPKPAKSDRIFKALNDLLHRSADHNMAGFDFSCNGTDVLLPLSDIVSIRTGRRNYLEITDIQGSKYETRMTLEAAQESLDDARFLMIIRGVLVNMEHIRTIEGEYCYLDNNERLTLNIKKSKELTAIWMNYKLDSIRNSRRHKMGGVSEP